MLCSIRIAIAAFMLIGLSACQHAVTPQSPSDTHKILIPKPSTQLTVNPARSYVLAIAYPAGAFAKLGHHHTIRWPIKQGTLWVTSKIIGSVADLAIPVAEARVDLPLDRQQASLESPMPSEADRLGTRRNLLGPEQLDASTFPTIRVRAQVSAHHEKRCYQARVTVTVKDHPSHHFWPVCDQSMDNQLVLQGCMDVSQTSLGLVPFSRLGGLLRVADVIRLCFHLEATAHSAEVSPSVIASSNESVTLSSI